MAHKKNSTNLTELLLQCMTQPDPMLSMLEWLCTRLMEAEVDQQLGAEKSQRSDGRSGYRSGYTVVAKVFLRQRFLPVQVRTHRERID